MRVFEGTDPLLGDFDAWGAESDAIEIVQNAGTTLGGWGKSVVLPADSPFATEQPYKRVIKKPAVGLTECVASKASPENKVIFL